MATKSICKHCRQFRWLYSSCLCRECAGSAEVRRLYDLPTKSAGPGKPPSPTRQPKPTSAQPGTEEKIQVLISRLWSGECLWHPRDNRGRK